ncbi:MAG TPA: YebC/PmpR family DNA-binding transcriptional regulator [Thermodesulfobacteriota bacterium]|nr:YebC/PmpR family DNA-binding transcriptional regulator [Deltaproteobacteria bacterium]HNR14365.1 YebC/PmpR family DNA-binding transcriptional regulator [Thermodesulfobacteriota bacterium]
MSGHSKWSTIKRKKGAADAKRGKVFSKLIKEITIAARIGGANTDGNPRLRSAITAARAENMPKDNIERAIKKGSGEQGGANYEEISYEGYGPGGAAVLVDALTDNRNRTSGEIRHIFSKHGGSLGEGGCVSWLFDKKGLIVFDKDKVDEEKLLEIALEAGVEDVKEEDTTFEVTTDPSRFHEVKTALDNLDMQYVLAEISMIPKNTVKLVGKEAEQMIRLMDALEDSDDVQKASANFDIPEEILEKMSG